MLEEIKSRALEGIGATIEEALKLNELYDTETLCQAADEVRRARCGNKIDTCSIVNARSGRCGEDCKWCAQSKHYNTGVTEYEIVPEGEMMATLERATAAGVKRFSLVTSGRKVAPRDLDRFCALYRKARQRSDIFLCASMGLLNRDELAKLWDAGVRRYHCNLETGSTYFAKLCTTHTTEDKLATIRAAREVGMQVCSGGIIGMGESLFDRLQMTAEARDAGAVSIPMNILNPIPGTPLENQPPIGEDEVVRTAALMRLVAPDVEIRFAGGRARMSPRAVEMMLRGGINAALVGDMLTTVGNDIDDDRALFDRVGLEM
ncbi:MAG: biotin synthase BioB [Muribaculaceae bacterium]|nr:biotin synthase BioB [Muribaculaceae bacterium]